MLCREGSAEISPLALSTGMIVVGRLLARQRAGGIAVAESKEITGRKDVSQGWTVDARHLTALLHFQPGAGVLCYWMLIALVGA